MSTIGVILVGYNTEDLLPRCLAPWVEARASKLDGHTFLICAVNTPFEGFPNEGQDSTRVILNEALNHGEIDHLIVSDVPMREIEARTAALVWLREHGATETIQVDSDEHFEVAQISGIFAWVAANSFVQWFRLSLRNYVFDDKTYLVEPFTPPRIHRVHPKVGVLTFNASCFVQDNDIAYAGGLTRDLKRQEQFASMTIPASVAFIAHMSWLSDERSRRKVSYQHARWGHCSFRWNEAESKLEFDPAYYEKTGQALPEVVVET